MRQKLTVVLGLCLLFGAVRANAITLYWGRTQVKSSSTATCMAFAGDAMRLLNAQNIRKSPDEVTGTLGGTYAAITCVATPGNATAMVMVVGENGSETMRVRDSLRSKVAGMIRFD